VRLVQRRSGAVAFATASAFAVIVAGLVSGAAGAQAPAPPAHARSPYVSIDTAVVALQHVTVIDGTGAAARHDETIVIEHGQIQAVGPSATVSIPAGARVLDLPGHTVIPGIVGLHDHMYYGSSVAGTRSMLTSYPRLFLASGVTTIRTTGSLDPYQEMNVRAAIERGAVVGPDIIVSGPYVQGRNSSVSWMHELSTPDDARRLVRYWSEEGVPWFKAYTQITRDELRAAIDEAHHHGMKVTAHLCSVGFREAVDMGIDNLEHGLLTDTEFWPGKQPDVCPVASDSAQYDNLDINGPDVRRTIDDMVSHHVAMTSTLAVFELSSPTRIPLDPRVYDALAPGAATTVRAWYDTAQHRNDVAERVAFAKAMAFERAFVKAGGLLGAGSDPCCLTEIAGYGDQRNFELLNEAGFTPEQAVQIMTSNGAKVLGISDRVGTIAPGKQADLVVVDGDVVSHPSIRNVTTVFRRGVGYDVAALTASVRGMVGLK
jgi:imidazolonepropionase-like amidohydrolase